MTNPNTTNLKCKTCKLIENDNDGNCRECAYACVFPTIEDKLMELDSRLQTLEQIVVNHESCSNYSKKSSKLPTLDLRLQVLERIEEVK